MTIRTIPISNSLFEILYLLYLSPYSMYQFSENCTMHNIASNTYHER